jgi:DNA-binding NtrC family response regulator
MKPVMPVEGRRDAIRRWSLYNSPWRFRLPQLPAMLGLSGFRSDEFRAAGGALKWEYWMSVLIVDDDENILIALKLLLKNEGMDCVTCRSPQEALVAVRRDACQLALVDLNYVRDTTSGKEGLALISALREVDEDLPIIAMTGWSTIGVAVEAMQRGAADFVEKPWDDNNRLLNIIRTQMKLRVVQRREKTLSAENALLREQSESTALICESPAMAQVVSLAKRVAASPMSILITGENGTGKGLLANYIHRHSPYARGPFISINMGAISETTFESEMYGHTKGAFTDAKAERIGRVELAEQGTLFMDEIANMPLAQQAKILRLLEERSFEKLGSSHSRQANVRFVSATNADLDRLVAERGFRQDLLYRLNSVTLKIPALRERKADILPLAESFLGRARGHYSSPAHSFSAAARSALEKYSWPGNVRELQHVVERSVLLAQEESIQEQDLQLSATVVPAAAVTNATGGDLADMTLDQAEVWLIQQALNRHRGNANDAARALGISRSALYRRLGKREPA